MADEKSVSRDLDDDPYEQCGVRPRKCGHLPGKAVADAEAHIAKLEQMAEELNTSEARQDFKARVLCVYIRCLWQARGNDNVAVNIPGEFSLENIVRARELFLKLPENLNQGHPKADFKFMMGRHGGNPYIILCAYDGTVI